VILKSLSVVVLIRLVDTMSFEACSMEEPMMVGDGLTRGAHGDSANNGRTTFMLDTTWLTDNTVEF